MHGGQGAGSAVRASSPSSPAAAADGTAAGAAESVPSNGEQRPMGQQEGGGQIQGSGAGQAADTNHGKEREQGVAGSAAAAAGVSGEERTSAILLQPLQPNMATLAHRPLLSPSPPGSSRGAALDVGMDQQPLSAYASPSASQALTPHGAFMDSMVVIGGGWYGQEAGGSGGGGGGDVFLGPVPRPQAVSHWETPAFRFFTGECHMHTCLYMNTTYSNTCHLHSSARRT